MIARAVLLKAGTALAALAGSAAPVFASATDEVKLVVGAPASPGQQYLGKRFNFSPEDKAAFELLSDGGLNYSPERDKLTLQSAK